MIAGLVRRHCKVALPLALLCALALVLTGFSGSPQGSDGAFSGPTSVSASAADGTITVTWTPGTAAASQVIVVVNVVDDTDYCLEVDATGVANSYQCAGRTEGETYVALVIALDGEGGYALGMTTQRVPVTFTGPERYPDLVVSTPTLGGDDPTIGSSFTLQTTVTNRGRESSGATTLRYDRSTEPVISSADTQVGSEPVGGLAAAGTSDLSMDLTAPSEPGIYYYRACVDRVPREANTTNNCSSVLAVNVVAPDLTVGTPTVAGDNPLLGSTFTMAATATNRGSEESAATTLRYYSSTDAAITTSDTELGTDAVGTLAAASASDQTVELTAPTDDGTYYYGACVDAVSDESDTGNNCSGALVMTLGAPDLVVSTPSVSVDNPTAGASFTLSATVRNQGSSGATAATLRYYRSTDATITTSDTALGTDSIDALAAFSASDQSIDLTAPSDAGTYYYGACVDTITGESSTTNNCSDALTVTVVAADLLVGTLTLEGDDPAVVASFTLAARVINQGGAQSGSTTVRFYRSDDATITTSDTQVGTSSVSSVAAAGVSTQSATLTAPSDAGDYYYGACVDTVSGESDTSNNCSSALSLTVEAPDLTVNTPTLEGDNPAVGTPFTLEARVLNQGGVESAATTLRYYRSSDATITTSDTEVGTSSVSSVAAAGVSTQSVTLTAPSDGGDYYYGACVDAVTGESDTANNCSTSVQVTVLQPQEQQHDDPDLVVKSPSIQFGRQHPGATFTLSVKVENEGAGASPATTLRYYRSTDAAISIDDTEVATDAVEALAASSTSSESVDLIAPTTPGRYWYGACVDAVTGESATTNNCSTFAVHITVTQPSDLAVGAPSVGDSSQAPEAMFTLSTTVENKGGGGSLRTTLRYYRSTDAAISTSDTEVASHGVGGLAAQHTRNQSADLTAPTAPGTYYYGACVDAVAGESDTTNNCSTSVQVTVTQPSDLAVGSPSVTDSSLDAGAWFTLSVTVENEGDGASPAATLRYYRSTDTAISTSDTEVDTDTVDKLAAPGTSSESVYLKAPTTPGTYYYGACVDAVAGESDTTNNCSTSVQVTAATLPDDCAASTSTTCAISVSGFTSGAIENSGDRDWIRITGQPSHGRLVAGHRYIFRVGGRFTIVHGVGFDALDSPVFDVLDSTGASLYTRTSGSIEFVAGATQVYYVAVSASNSTAIGGYGVGTVNTTASTIQNLQIRSDPGDDDTYSVNDVITVRVRFSSSVSVTGTPQLALDIGGVTRHASYTGGTDDLTFSYTVAEGDNDTDGIAISANSVTTPGGSSIRADGMDVPLHHGVVPADSGHNVDGSATP